MGNDAPTETATNKTATGTSTANGSHDVTTDEPKHVNNHIPKSRYIRQQNKVKKQQLTAVFNYSDINLSNDMNDLLNLGLKFAILPIKLDITQVLVDFKTYERSLVWQEFFHSDEKQKEYIPPIFKTKNLTFLRTTTHPKALKQ